MSYVQSLALAAGILASAVDAAAAEDARLTWKLADGSVVAETRRLEEKGDVSSLTVPAAEIRAKKAKGLVVTPSFGHAARGEAGYWFSPYGYYGEWDCEKGAFVAERERMSMPMYGWATSLDGRPLDESRRILLTHVTDVQNENAMFKDATFSELRYWGESPLVRVGSAEVSLRHAHPETCRVWALRPDGTRKCEVPTSIRDGRLVLRVSIAAPDPSLHYEIVCPYRNYLSQDNAS